MCPPPRLLITISMMWCDIDPCDWSNKFYGFYMATVVGVAYYKQVYKEAEADLGGPR